MLAVLSPAKKLDFGQSPSELVASQPVLGKHTTELLKTTKSLKTTDLAQLMKLSDSLAELNYDRFQSFAPKAKQNVNAKQAALAFAGDTYTGLQAPDFTPTEFEFAQEHLRILSGLYGILRPLDLIQPYRLEMGTRLPTPRGKNLYEFWGHHISSQINKDFKKQGLSPDAAVLINLASNEYFSAVDRTALKARLLTCVFKENRNGQLKIISFSAKKARGMMARFIIKNQLSTPEGMKDFREAKYRYQSKMSNDSEWVFVR